MFGYMGKLLRVNLSEGKINEEDLDLKVAKEYIGGAGLATRIIYDEIPPDADPLGPKNKLLFMTGPLTGTVFPTTGRYEVCTKSPLTGIWLDSSSSGFWGSSFKHTGYDGIILEGISPMPVYLWISDDHVELRDASHLWGEDAFVVQDRIKEELDDKKISIACIGPAGEREILLSCIMTDGGRAAGRGGAGAVMGSKKLKAVAVRGVKEVPLADMDACRTTAEQMSKGLAGSLMGKYGTPILMDTGWPTGDVPIQNWRKGLWKEGCINIGGKKMAETIGQSHSACWTCPIKCARQIKIETGKYAIEGPGPEYEVLAAFGSMCLNDNLEAICWANDLCNRYGLDTISTGAAIAFAMEAYERGIISKRDTDGLDLSWGNEEAIIGLLEMIGQRKGLGKIIGNGVKRASQKLGRETKKFTLHVKGMEVPMHDPRASFSMAVNYATSPRGACHLHGMTLFFDNGAVMPEAGIASRQGKFDREGKGLIAKVAQDLASIFNSMVVCIFASHVYQPQQAAEVLGMVTGIPYTSVEVLKIGERISNLQRAFNNRCGITREDDKLPLRLLEPTNEGAHAGKVPDVEYQLEEYYQVRGWTPDGKPSKEKLSELGLDDVIQDLYIEYPIYA